VKAQLSIAPVRPTLGNRRRHIRQPDGAIVGDHTPPGLAVVSRQGMAVVRHGHERAIPFGQLHLAAEEVGVGHHHRSGLAIDLDVVVPMVPDVPAGAEGDQRTGCEFQDAMDRRRRFDGDLLALPWPAADRAGRKGCRRHGADLPDRAHQIDQHGDVVRAEVEHRPPALPVKEVGIGVPALGSPRHYVAGSPDDPADLPRIDKGTGRLSRRAEEGVGGRPQSQPNAFRDFNQLSAQRGRRRQRLFGIDVLAGLERRQRDLVMSRRNCQVDDEIDVIGLKQVDNRAAPHAVPIGASFRCRVE